MGIKRDRKEDGLSSVLNDYEEVLTLDFFEMIFFDFSLGKGFFILR